MTKALLFDFSRTLLFPKDKTYIGGLNDLHKKISENPNYDFLESFELNKELLSYLETIKNKLSLYVFTSESIQEDPAIKNDVTKIFSKIFSAKELGLSKKDPKAYELIAKELNLNSDEILFIDDSSENLEAAKSAELQTLQYKDNSIINELNTLV